MSDSALFLLLIVLQLADYELTTGILKRGGRELNPVMREMLAKFGDSGFAFSKVFVMAVGGVLCWSSATLALVILCVVYAAIVIWNWSQVRKHRG